jgi:hypothetical protein
MTRAIIAEGPRHGFDGVLCEEVEEKAILV